VRKKVVLELELDVDQGERLGADLCYLLEKTKDLPGTVRGPEGEFAVDARERIAAFVDLIVKALKG